MNRELLLPEILFKDVKIVEDVSNLSSTGPETWHKECPIAAKGKRQSPIDLKTSGVEYDADLKPVVVSYPAFSDAMFLNNGHSVQFQPGTGNLSGNTKRVGLYTTY